MHPVLDKILIEQFLFYMKFFVFQNTKKVKLNQPFPEIIQHAKFLHVRMYLFFFAQAYKNYDTVEKTLVTPKAMSLFQ